METITITKTEYETLLKLADYAKRQEAYRKAPIEAKRIAEQHLRLLNGTEDMDTPTDYLTGYNRYAEIKVTEANLTAMRQAYHEYDMYGLLPEEYRMI